MPAITGGDVKALRWVGGPVTEGGVTERSFELDREGSVVPGVLWLPAQPERRLPLVLMGHGGSGHKRADRQLDLGRWFAGEAQMAAAAIDGPFHGDRVAEPLDAHEYQKQMAARGVDTVTDGMVADWCATVHALGELDTIDAQRLAYIGLSMGTRFGLPYVAAEGNRLRCAVFGKYGMRQPAEMPAAIDMASRFTRDAPRITVPILFHVQWDDELFPRNSQFELFELLASPDKQLIAFPGKHGATAPAAITAWREFVTRHLAENDGEVAGMAKAEFGFPGPQRDRLVGAILEGSKTTTTGLLVDYEHGGEPLPEVGSRSAVVDSDDRPVAIIEVTDVRVVPLADVDLAHVVDEGEGTASVAEWRAGHERFWHSAEMRAAIDDPEFTVDDETPVVLERFRVTADLRAG
jgi:uncharacterized protein YhfF